MDGPEDRRPDDEVGEDDPQTRREEVELDLMEAGASEAGEHIDGVVDEVEPGEG